MPQHAIAQLKDEQRLIERMLDKVAGMLAPYDSERVGQALSFFTQFVDRVHHAKIRTLLELLIPRGDHFAATARSIIEAHVGLRNDLSDLLRAHRLAADGDLHLVSTAGGRLLDYRDRLRSQLAEEGAGLFVAAADVITDNDDERLVAGFSEAQHRLLDDVQLNRLVRMAEQSGQAETLVVARRSTAPASRREPHALEARTLAVSEVPESTGELDVRVIFQQGDHRVLVMTEPGDGLAVEANQYLIAHDDAGMLLDPGGPKVYPHVAVEVTRALGHGRLDRVFLSHQDPDILTSLNAWLFDTQARVSLSKIWARFVPHFGIETLLKRRLDPIPDEGQRIELAGSELILLPAHFLHSCGNFQVYDPVSRILFSGDLGASVGAKYAQVRDFDKHVHYMEAFHRRYMVSQSALQAWAKMVRTLEIDAIAPQHGAIFVGAELVERFIGWCEGLECGIDLMLDTFQVPS